MKLFLILPIAHLLTLAAAFQAVSSPLFRRGGSIFASSSDSSSSLEEKDEAIVIGGGPVGLASALTLAKAGYQVSVYEATPAEEMKIFNPAVAYLYNVNVRGQVFTKQFPFVHDELLKRSVASNETGSMIAPADTVKNITISGPRTAPVGTNDDISYWIPRHEMNLLLWEAIDDYNLKKKEGEGYISFQQGMKCINVSSSAEKVSVELQNVATQELSTQSCKLLVGADGLKSQVRTCLYEKSSQFDFDFDAKKFKLKKYTSPATGLKLKALQLPTDELALIDANGEEMATKPTDFVVTRSVTNGPYDRLSVGCLPSKKSIINIRPGNTITRPNHKLWTIKTGNEMKAWFKEIFPRVDWEKFVNDEEWERYAKAEGLTFPPCQYSPGLQACKDDGDCGVVLLGDAAHSFSPDIGQGINAGLRDVVQFGELLKESQAKKEKLSTLLKAYEKVRAPETKALIRIARFGAPLQYNQSLRKDRIHKMLWTMNLAMRLLLNKITFGLFPQPMIMLLQDSTLSYKQVANRADAGTVVLKSILAILLLRKFVPRFL
ncbi:hypothetical protein CTEN210_12903 [Chaetoceros tenuissimus]|uniref:FAD-binding domain-containing protein n=1 Tax=Chaetoceros tenuissimus TaxID=426638 RepID=A0AAD3D220_9STRA|nr:hypothetical protein CTEN210_12903 [Chaetoceros tenuissimus]